MAAYIPKYKTEQEAYQAYQAGQATAQDVADAGYYQTYGDQKRALEQRLALGQTGAVARIGSTFNAGDLDVHARFFNDDPNAQFIEYEGGGVKFATPEEIAAAGQPTNKPVFAGSPNETSTGQLAIKPSEGKEVARTGQTVKNPQTGVDVAAPEGFFYVENKDGTVELRSNQAPNQPTEAKPIGTTGPTAQELGITRQTEIKGGPGPEVTRAPQTAAQALAAAKTPEEKDAVIQGEGLASTADLELIGSEYTDQATGVRRIAKPGNVFYQAADGTVLERSAALQSLAKETTSPSVLAERQAAQVTGPTLSDSLKSSLSGLGLPIDEQSAIQALRDRPIPNAQQLYSQIQIAQGVPTVKAQIDQVLKEIKDLDDKYAKERAGVDENPWLSESLRDRKNEALQGKYETQRSQLTARQQLYQTILQDARQEAQFLTGSAIQQANADRQFDMQALQLAFEREDAKLDSQIKLAGLDLQKQQFEQAKKEFEATFGLQQADQLFNQQLQLKQFGLSAARESRLSGGSGSSGGITSANALSGSINTSGLSPEAKAVLANPSLLSQFSATQKGKDKILKELAGAGVDLSGFGLPAVSAEQRGKLATFDDITRNIGDALSQISAGVSLGPVASRTQQAKQALGIGDPKYTNYASAVAQISSNMLRALSGVAITPQEYERIKPYIPVLTDQEDTAKRKLERLQAEISLTRNNLAQQLTQTPYQIQQSVMNNDPLGLR